MKCCDSFSPASRAPLPKAGFSLTEIALALMVVGVGMIAVLGIFPLAIGMKKDATGNGRMASLGEEVLHRMRIAALNPKIDWDNPDDMDRGIDNGAIKKGWLDIALPVPDRWGDLPSGLSVHGVTKTIRPYPLSHELYSTNAYQVVWYTDARVPEIDAYSIGVRVTIFKNSDPATASFEREVEVAMWQEGLYSITREQPDRNRYFPPAREGAGGRLGSPDFRMFGTISRSLVDLYDVE